MCGFIIQHRGKETGKCFLQNTLKKKKKKRKPKTVLRQFHFFVLESLR